MVHGILVPLITPFDERGLDLPPEIGGGSTKTGRAKKMVQVMGANQCQEVCKFVSFSVVFLS